MKILHVFNVLRYSGAEFLLSSAASLFLKDDQHTLLSTGTEVGEFAPTLQGLGFAVQHLPFRKHPGFFADLMAVVRNGQYDIVHVHTERASFWYALAARLVGTEVIRTIHSEFVFEGNLRRLRGAERRLLEWMGIPQVACSERVGSNERLRFGTKPLVIENWIDPSRVGSVTQASRAKARAELSIPADQFAVLSVGNQSPVKNHEAILEAIAACSPELCVHYYHCGYSDQTLRDAVPPLVADQVHFLGPVPDIAPWMSACDALVTSSFAEGGPLSLLEGAASGIPNITTRVGLSGVFADMPSVTFVEPTGASIAEAIRGLARIDLDTRIAQGEAASRLVISRFTPEVGATKYIALYRQIARCSHAEAIA